MKGESGVFRQRERKNPANDPESIALQALGCIVADPNRLERFLALTGLQPDTIRSDAAKPGFLSACLDYLVSDEGLLVAVSGEMGLSPQIVAAAQARLSGAPEWFP